MPLVTTETPSPAGRNPWRGLVVGAIASLVFVLIVAAVARATRDEAGGVPREDIAVAAADAGGGSAIAGSRDGGVDAAGAAAVVDAGAMEGPEGEPDAGPAEVAGPPVIAADVVAVTLPLVEDCLKKALRFDPALGGKARLHIVVADGKLAPSMPGASSPVLSQCVAAGAATLAWPTVPEARHEIEARIVLDGLRKTIRVESTELIHTPPQ